MAVNTTEIDVLLNAKLNASNAVSGIGDIQKAMRNLTLPKGISADLEKSFSKLTPLLKDYQKQLDKGFSSQKDIKNFNLLKDKIDSVFGDIKNKVQEVNGQEIRLKVDTEAIDALQNRIVKAQADLENALQNVFKKNQSAASIETKFNSLEKVIPKNWTRVQEMLSGASTSFKAGNFAEFNRELQKTSDYIQNLKSTAQIDLAHKLGMSKAKTDLTDAQTHLNNFFNSLKTNIREANKVEELRAKLAAMGTELENLNISSVEDGPKAFEAWIQSITGTTSALDKLHTSTQETANGMVRMVDEVNELKRSTQYFFSLRNMINLLKQGVRDAVESIKELDKAMTDTAVVTEFNVADMWRDLPKYTQLANQLGATTQGAYETMTLYYQQGLNQQQAFALGAETMKMARIAGLDYAETTDMMTAALRGFNMELDEVSAKRVNDVYSELAAITASDTEEIGSAMQRTASIAHSAGMSFEGTSAFLAQAIETTREAPENIGTAMKTIVARFQEMKKNPLEITEVDGEEVNYNKIDEALKTIGVDLKDTNGQFRELDQVFLDISSRWDSLTQTQQRYIATTAAGSRQQSRFIAMMDNYDRTVQLMEAARNSAGASDEQFNKTMDSLEAKINKFQNAWKEFTMGLANDKMVKGVIDALTTGLGAVNKIITSISKNPLSKALGIEGGTKSVLSLVAAFSGIKAFGRFANAGVGALGGLVDPQSTWKEGWRQGLTGLKGGHDRQNITNPIIQAINGLIPHIDKEAINNTPYKYQERGDYNGARREFKDLLESNKGTYSLNQLTKNIFDRYQLNEKQQAQFFEASPGLRKNVAQQLGNIYKQAGTSPEVAKGLVKGFKQGSIALDRALAHESLFTPFSERISQIEEKQGSDIANALRTKYQTQFEEEGTALGLLDEELRAYKDKRFANLKLPKEGIEELMMAMNQRTPMEKFQDGLGQIGAGLLSAGSTLQMFGSTLSATNPVLGEFVSGLGSTLTTMGSLANTIPALMNPLTLAAAAVSTLIYVEHKRVQGIKDSAEEVSKNFEETNKTTQENIASLKAYRNELATLSKGVDANGYNINLSDADYERYLQIVDDIAAMNPEIVEGYNAQGHAIINNNTALAETLALQEQIQKKATEDYINSDSLQKLINARNVDKNYKASTTSYQGSYKTGVTAMTDNVIAVAKQLQKTDWFDESLLEQFGIHSLDALLNGEEQAVQAFVKNQDQINSQLSNAASLTGKEFSESLTKSFADLSEQTDLFNEAIAPIYQNLATQVSQNPFYESIEEGFKPFLMSGLKDIASQDIGADEMIKQSNNMVARFANLTTGSGKYADALKIVEKAQDNFADTLNETEYRAEVQPAIDDLIRLKEEALQEGGAYGNALAEYLDNQIQRIANFTKEGSANLTEALNTATDEIAAAEGALESFNSATEKDFSTAAEGMKGIFDKTTETFKDSYGAEIQKHAEGMGDATFWAGADALLSEKAISKATKGKDGYEAAEAVAKKIKDLEPMLREGQEGFDAFTDRVLANADAMDKLAEAGVTYDKESGLITNIPDDQWHNVAEALGISDDLLTSMLNKGRQFADISFMNVEEARKALASSDFTIKGTTAANGEQQVVYVKESTLRQQLSEAGYVRKEQQDEQIKKLNKQNIDLLKPAEEYKKGSEELKKKFDDMGAKTLPDLIRTLNDTGDFNRDEIKAYADKLGMLGDEQRFDSLYSSIIEATKNPEVAKQTSILSSINAKFAALLDTRTGEQAEKDFKEQREDLYGKKGEHDTEAQAFGDGFKINENGTKSKLTAGEYEETKKHLQELGQSYRDTAAIAVEKAKTAADAEEKLHWQKVAEMAEKDADYIDILLDRGAEAFKKNQDEIDKEVKARKSKDENRTQQNEDKKQQARNKAKAYVDEHGFLNTDINNRQEVNWGKDSTQNKNFEAAATWFKNRAEAEKQLNNSISTYLSSANTYTDKTGGEFSLAFTPILQGTDGRGPQVLSKDTVNSYFDEIIKQATDEHGKINIDKLIELDETGIEGFESQGERIRGLLMGIIEGENSGDIAGAIGQLEHNLEEAKQKAKETEEATRKATEKAAKESAPKVAQKTVETAKKVTQTTNETINKQVNETEEKVTATGNEDPSFTSLTQKIEQYKNTPVADFELNASANTGNIPEVQASIDDIYQKFATPPVLTVNNKDAITKIDTASRAIGVLPSKKNISLTATDHVTSKLATIGDKIASIARKAASVVVGGGFRGTKTPQVSHGIPTFGSAARGRYGTVGPKNKGGLTLTGEKGFEIAWLPSENRSMIVGAGGPQMISLPGDAVIYNHEQSKDILKRKGIPAGSHAAESATGSSYKKKYISYTNSASKTTSNKTAKKTSQSVQKAAKTIETVSAKAGKVFVWWENMARSVEKAQRDAEKNQKTLERLLKNFGTTLSEYDEASKPYKEALEKQINLANQRIEKANDELHITDYGADSKKSNDYLAAIGARQEISYEITKTKKKKGKKTTTTETKKETLNLAKYIKLIDGVYQLNQAEIDKVAKSNKSRAEAIKAAAEKQLNDLYSKLKAAEDDRIKAEEALQQFYNDAYEAFSRWDKSITAVYLLGQQLEKLSAEANIYESAVDLQTSKLEAGFAKAIDVLPQITSALERNRDIMIAQVQTNAAKVDAAWKEYSDSLSLRTITEKYLANQSSTDAAYDYDVMKNTLTFLQNAGLDQSNFNLDTAAKALEELYANQWKGDDYEKIKEGLDKIAEKQGDYYSTLADTYSSINEVYQKIEEYQSYMADFEGTLIKGIEDQANKQIDRLNKLNSSLSTTAKDIIDEVKRKLDERRKQEDNAKTESEISQKQQRLAALRADTAGGHATEIAQLEKEIADSQQSYGRTLEDQLLDRLSQQQDNAEKQRERQIALLEAQRDFAAATGSNVDQINKWLQDPANYAEEIKSAFLANNNFEELGELERQQLLQEFESKFGTYLAYAEVLPDLVDAASQEWPESISEDVPNSLDGIEDKIDTIIGLLGDGTQLISELNSDAMTLEEFKEQGADAITARALSTDQGRTYTAKNFIDAGYTPTQTKEAGFTATDFKQSDVSYDDAKAAGFTDTQLIEGGYDIPSTPQTATTPSTPAKTDLWKTIQDTFKKLNIDATGGTLSPLGAAALAEAKKHKGAKVSIGSQDARVGGSGEIYWDRKGTVRKWNPSTGKVTTFKYNKATYIKEANKANSPYVYEEFRESLHTRKVKGYKTGGLATQTGPAWLDGTPAKPELVLNAQDTKNFIALKDILAHAMGSTNNINNSYGGNATYEININVDHINNDYDVDKITKRVKENIIKDSSYRNVTQVRKFR